MDLGWLVPIVITLIIVITVVSVIGYIRAKLRYIARKGFGTDSISEGIAKVRQDVSETPRSLQAMTSMYLPQIQRDFPDFDYYLYKSKAEGVLRTYLNAIESKDVSGFSSECSNSLVDKTVGVIEELESRNVTQHFDQPVIHRTEISRYIKLGSTITIRFVSAVGVLNFITDANDKVVFGDRSAKLQTVYEVDLVYVQDVTKMTDTSSATGLGVNCPNCGAPITNLGYKFCQFCGTGVQEINVRSWKFADVREQTERKRQY